MPLPLPPPPPLPLPSTRPPSELPAACLPTSLPAPHESFAGEAAAGLQDVAAAARRAPAASHRLLATSAGGTEPDQLPLPESKLKDDVEDALHGEAEELPVDDGAEAALAAGGAARPAVPAGGVAALPLGQGLRQEASFQGRPWTFETGRMARLANGSCMVQAGGTTVLAATTCQPPPWSRRDALSLQFEVRGWRWHAGGLPWW